MAKRSEKKYTAFDRELRAALEAFLKHEEENGGAHPDAAVRAGQFNQFAYNFIPRLEQYIDPDLCEEYLKRYHYITLPLDEAQLEPLTPAQRHVFGTVAYARFRNEATFSGERKAEIEAFYDYVCNKFPHSLPAFTIEEAEECMEKGQGKERNSTLLALFLGVICTVALSSTVFSFFPTRSKPDEPAPSGLKSKKDKAPDDRIVVPDIYILPDPGRQPALKKWQHRFDKDERDSRNKDGR